MSQPGMSSTSKALSADDVLALLARLQGITPPVLVGGQALNILARHYRIDSEAPLTSQDVDFVGDEDEAEVVARAWQADLRIPSLDDHTPNTAILVVPRPGGQAPLTVDFLDTVAGVAFGGSVAFIELKSPDYPCTLRVLHPMACVQSRLWNIYGPLNRHDTREIERLRLAIRILHRHLTEHLPDSVRNGLNLVERFCRHTVLSRAGKQAWHHDHVDLMEAIPYQHPAWPPLFREKRWPELQRHVQEARARSALSPKTQQPRPPSF